MLRALRNSVPVLLVGMATLLVGSGCGAKEPAAERPAPAVAQAAKDRLHREDLPEFNRLVLEVIQEYPADGTHDYWWPRAGESNYDGGTQDMQWKGSKVMSGEPQRRTFCCGMTLEVFLRAVQRWEEKHGPIPDEKLSPKSWKTFQRNWFVLEVNGPGPSLALESAGLGRTIPAEEAKPGDFVQLWRRSGSGHSVVFLDWVRDEKGGVIGFRYWSTQPPTKGIGEVTEYFGPKTAEKSKAMAKEFTHFARVDLPGKGG